MYENEASIILDKKYECPVCNEKMTSKSVKSNSAKFVETKVDLRPKHSNVNVTKYDCICCHNCGFAALTKNFTSTTSTQRKLLREKIASNYTSREEVACDVYTTEMAISRMKMALLCTVTKGGKSSEIGNVCLKISWLYQDLIDDDLDENAPDYEQKKALYQKEADNAAKKAYEHLSNARMTEDFPIAGMNETTLDYLLSYYAYINEEYPVAMKYLSGVLTSRSTSPRLKDKALELKELVGAKLHDDEAAE